MEAQVASNNKRPIPALISWKNWISFEIIQNL